ncbi:MAG: 6-carboxytetrahydropterin synthase [Candidatus Thermoplasmatota archaeon]|nr:6-carboxytetrahydropterin synthase [Euryarchaeota archaeon]MBU4032449.1 6-carboxytetrahydropterin synthase [Candidatus Thermoplasmatota archaeon]MBU4071562.1 6-carboxytetrahydropterin synthase [Candidatus Thermoplasmatota archaeon]MBU4144471.1 6-carboxytetrahydropterin synthase [Candidatus Thermoplasmatota archaeon]MBU4592297.1 6-carboxytetrahydropterin synthase [Candidatus Thermoplasmatota archaeon]
MKLKLDGWQLGITFSACHFLPGHSKCNRLHGHNYAVHLHITGEPLDGGMVHDFVALKKAMKSVADQMDHCVLMPGKSKVMKLEHVGTQINVSFENKSYSFPKDDVKILDLDLVSAEMMAIYALDSIVAQLDLGGNITKIKVGIDEGIGQGAWASREL